MFTFCMERFHMSEQVTAKRLWAARTARRFPVVLEMVARGELHLSAIHLLARHLTSENHVQVLGRARHKSSREIERLVAELAPRADVPSRIRAMPGPGRAGAASDRPAMEAEASVHRASIDREQAGGASLSIDRTTVGGSSDRPASLQDRDHRRRGHARQTPLAPGSAGALGDRSRCGGDHCSCDRSAARPDSRAQGRLH
jgi:hypothetical protein